MSINGSNRGLRQRCGSRTARWVSQAARPSDALAYCAAAKVLVRRELASVTALPESNLRRAVPQWEKAAPRRFVWKATRTISAETGPAEALNGGGRECWS